MLFTVHHDAEKTHCVEIHVGRQYEQHRFRLELCILTLISVHLQLKIGCTPTIHGLLKIIVKNNNVVPYLLWSQTFVQHNNPGHICPRSPDQRTLFSHVGVDVHYSQLPSFDTNQSCHRQRRIPCHPDNKILSQYYNYKIDTPQDMPDILFHHVLFLEPTTLSVAAHF